MSLQGLVPIIQNAQSHLRSSSNEGTHTTANCMLNFKNNKSKKDTQGSGEAWVPSVVSNNQYIVSGSENPRTFRAVSIQGRGDADQWVTSYRIRYSLDNVTWFDYDSAKAISGCTDRDTVNTHFFNPPIRARSVSIRPVTWSPSDAIALRWELYAEPQQSMRVSMGTDIYTGDNCALNIPGQGKREVIVPVKFDYPFNAIPKVCLTLDHIDCVADLNPDKPDAPQKASKQDKSYQIRVGVQAKDITTTGFNAVFYTWEENKCYSLRADYIACSME